MNAVGPAVSKIVPPHGPSASSAAEAPEALEATEAIDEVVRRVAHDFNNVLLAVRGYGQLALRGLERDLDVSTDIKEMIAAADRGVRLVRELRRCRWQLIAEVSDHVDISAAGLRESEEVE